MAMRHTLLAMGFCLLSATASATCQKGPDFVKTTNDAYGVGIGLGHINVSSVDIQPVGTVLASSVVNFSDNPRYKGPDSVLWVCDISDVNNIYEIIATNGDDRSGGYWDMGMADGNPNVYGTWFNYVGLRLTHMNSGKVFTRNYQRIPMTRYAVSDDGKKISIRVKDFSPIRAEAIRVSAITPSSGAPSSYCGTPKSSGSYSGCSQPNAYVSFCSPGSSVAFCDSGDSALNYDGWWYDNWMAMNMGTSPAATLSSTATCVAKNVTPVVIFPTISRAELEKGQQARAAFNVSVRCENTAVSGVASSQTALGLQVSYASYQAAQTLGLVNSSGGVSHLLSENYGQSGIASGVGIQIANAGDGVLRQFIGWDRCSTAGGCVTGNSGGWYPVRDGATLVSGGTSVSEYMINFNAILTRLPGLSVTPGRVDARAYVWVKVQ
ncbi:fimbrial protein [Enterobacter asburiae]